MNLLEATVSSNGGGTTLKFGSNTLTVPASVLAARPSLTGYDGKRVAVGIRPEHLTVAADGAPDTIKGVVDVREGLGSEVILHVTTDAIGVDTAAAENKAETSDRVVVARVEPHATAQIGERTASPSTRPSSTCSISTPASRWSEPRSSRRASAPEPHGRVGSERIGRSDRFRSG